MITRGSNAINIDGSKASGGDKGFAVGGVAFPFVGGSTVKNGVEFIGERTVGAYKNIKGLYSEAHHIIQDAAVKNLPGYNKMDAPTIHLEGPAYDKATPHGKATQTQKKTVGGGTYAAERRIGYRALRNAGVNRNEAKAAIKIADNYFEGLGFDKLIKTDYPKMRTKI
jgi:hypothetical protein